MSTGIEVLFNICECFPEAVPEGVVEMYVDYTTIYCIGNNMDVVTQQLNLIFLAQIYKWSQKLSVHSGKNEAIIFSTSILFGPLRDLNDNNNRMDLPWRPS